MKVLDIGELRILRFLYIAVTTSLGIPSWRWAFVYHPNFRDFLTMLSLFVAFVLIEVIMTICDEIS